MAATTTLRTAVIGAGWWGHTHIEAYWRNPQTTLVAICGRSNRARTEEVAGQYNARAYCDIAAMLEKERPDLVSIIVGDDAHYAPYKQVIDAGVNCLLEKPLALELAQGRELVQLARARGIHCGVNFNHRYTTPFQLLKRHVAEGKIGRPAHLLWRFTGGHYPEGMTMPMAHLIYMQSHGFNIMQTFGGPLESIAGHASDPRRTGQWTSATFSLQFTSGAVGSFIASVDGDYKDPNSYSFEMMGDAGRVLVTDAIRRFEYIPRQDNALAQVWRSHFFDEESRQFTRTVDRHIAEFVHAMLSGEPEPIPIEEGLAAMELAHAAIQAITERRVVTLESAVR